MNFFPVPYPDEILSSTLARYSVRSGNTKIIHNLEDLFSTRKCIAVMELPTRLDTLIKNMPVGNQYSSEYFIYKHTMFPYYAAFITKERAEKVISVMKSGEGDTYVRTGLISSNIPLNEHYKFCPECMKEDRKLYGELYWHRVHQAAGVFVCQKHKVPLFNSKILIRGYNRQRFIRPTADNCNVDSPILYSSDLIEKLFLLAQDAEILLNNSFNFKPPSWFKNHYRQKLVEKGYAKLNNMIHQKRLSQDILDYYGEEFLSFVHCRIPFKGECKWISDLTRDNEKTIHTLRHLVLARFLGISVQELFMEANDLLTSIALSTSVELDQKIISLYTKSIDATVGEGANNNTINNKETYILLWEERLKELCNKKLSLRQIAKELNSTPKTIKRHILSNGIEPFWKYNGGKRYGDKDYKDTEDFKIKQKESRKKWLSLIEQYPRKSRNELRYIDVTLSTWLLRYDKEWMLENSPNIKSKYKPVDWSERDKELLPKVKRVVEEIKSKKSERVCWSTIGSKLGVSGWLSKRKDKLLMTKAYIESVEEDISDFQVRKIRFAIEELEDKGKAVTYWNLLEEAGVKPRYLPKIRGRVEPILLIKGYGKELLYLEEK